MRTDTFRGPLLGLACVVATLAGATWRTNVWAQEETDRAKEEQLRARQTGQAADQSDAERYRQEALLPPLRRFLQAWAPHEQPAPPPQDLAVVLRSTLENAAQRKLGLVTDHAITPEIVAVSVQGRPVPVQRATLRASGESLAALLIWLGDAEARFPLARVEQWEVASTGGKNTALKLTLAQPVLVATARRNRGDSRTGGAQP